ncbi:MAG TPA: T9SS type A sorting domain-containing protein [Saprospiraceae bacterium]|nr:T9SS type A sorting domain-containing protein [Saprospiraceae bacterium]
MKIFNTIFFYFVFLQTPFLQTFTKYDFANEEQFNSGANVADLNSDQFPDIIIGDRSEINMYINNKNGKTFNKFLLTTTSAWKSSFATIDIDGDNDIDILVGGEGKVILFRNISTSSEIKFEKAPEDFYNFSSLTSSVPILAKSDVNNDGKTDVVVSYGYTDVLFQRENYVFSKVQITNDINSNVRTLEVEDLNNDDKLDIILTTGNTNIDFYINNGNETFLARRSIYGSSFKDFVVSDLNGDNYNDVVTFDYAWDSHMKIFENEKSTDVSFREKKITSNFFYNFSSLAKGDFNNDDKVDFVVGFEQNVGLTLITNTSNNSNFNFNFTNLSESSGNSIDLFVIDLDVDGDDDILHLPSYGGFSLYLNGIISNTKDDVLNDVSIFPNPVSSTLQIKTTNPCSINSVKVYDYLGTSHQVLYQTCDSNINVEHLTKGTYFIELMEGTSRKVARFIKM